MKSSFNNLTRNLVFSFSLLGLFALTGCIAPVAPNLEIDARAEAEAKKFVPYPDKAVIYVYRTDRFLDHTQIFLNGQQIATIQRNLFTRAIVPPGRYAIKSVSKSNWARAKTRTIDVKEGHIYYMRDKISVDYLTPFIYHSLKLRPDSEAQNAIIAYGLVNDWYVE
jgi:hypothetical protein